MLNPLGSQSFSGREAFDVPGRFHMDVLCSQLYDVMLTTANQKKVHPLANYNLLTTHNYRYTYRKHILYIYIIVHHTLHYIYIILNYIYMYTV